jgi:hypothetical protein
VKRKRARELWSPEEETILHESIRNKLSRDDLFKKLEGNRTLDAIAGKVRILKANIIKNATNG